MQKVNPTSLTLIDMTQMPQKLERHPSATKDIATQRMCDATGLHQAG